jgi:hypothetical protein
MVASVKDSELQLILLRHLYERRNEKQRFSAGDFQGLFSPAEFGRICIQLRDKGWADWKAPAGEEMLAIGSARITTKGIEAIEQEATEAKPAEITKRPQITVALCPNCQDERDVLILITDTKRQEWYYDENAPPAYFYEKSSVLKCAGCQFVFLQKERWDTETTDEHGRSCVSTEYFPKWAQEPIPEWITSRVGWGTSNPILEKLREVLLTFESGWHWLACVGCRSVLEAAMVEKIGDKGTFKQNLEAYYAAGYISAGDKDQLGVVIEAGHGATHRSFRPTREQVKTAIDIVCRILQGIYVHGPQAQNLKASIPPREKI